MIFKQILLLMVVIAIILMFICDMGMIDYKKMTTFRVVNYTLIITALVLTTVFIYIISSLLFYIYF